MLKSRGTVIWVFVWWWNQRHSCITPPLAVISGDYVLILETLAKDYWVLDIASIQNFPDFCIRPRTIWWHFVKKHFRVFSNKSLMKKFIYTNCVQFLLAHNYSISWILKFPWKKLTFSQKSRHLILYRWSWNSTTYTKAKLFLKSFLFA